MAGHKGGRKGTRRKGSNAKVAAPTASAAAIPKAPSHSLVDYSKFDNIEDSSEEEEDTISPGCCCEKCRNAWPHDDPDEEALDENDRHDKESTSMATTKSTSSARPAKAAASSSGFSFSKALGDAAKKQIAEGKAARSANLQASAHRSSSHPDHLGLTKSVSPGKQCHVASQGLTTESAMDRLFAMQNKIISAFLERKGLGRMVPTVVHALNCYRQSDTAEESPDEAVFRIFSGLEIPVDCDEIPSLPAALPTNDQSPKSKVNSNVWTENSSEQLGNVLKKHGFDSFQIGDFPNGQPRVLASAGPFSKKTANGYADSDQTTEPSNVDSDGDEMPDLRPYEDNTPKMPVGTKPKSATSAGSKASGPKSSSTQADASTWMPTGPDWKQNRPKGVYTLQEMFEGTGLFGASGPDASSPKKKPAKPKPVQATAASTKPAPAKAAPAKAASAKTGSTKQSKAKAAAAAEANAWMDVIAAGGRTLKEHAERSAGLGPASGKAPTSKPAKGASASQDQPVNRSRLRQSYEQARKADVQTTNDDDDIPSLCSTNSNASDYDDDDGASDGDDESVESIDVTVPPGRTLWPPQAPAPQAKPKSTASAAPNATAGNRPSAGAPPKPVPEPLFREEPRGPLAGLYQARAASVAKASAERKAANFMKGAFDKPKAAGSKSSKAESGQDVSSQGFKGIFAAQPKSKVMADADSGHDSGPNSKSEETASGALAGEAGSRSGAPVKKAGAKPNGDTAAYMDDRPKQNAFTYPGYAQPGISSQQSVKEALKQKAAERELQAEKAMRELLEEEEREKAEAAANADKARKEKQKHKKARRKAKKETQKPLPQAAAPDGTAEVDEVSDEEDSQDYPLDNRFAFLSGSGVPLPSHGAAHASFHPIASDVSTKKQQPTASAKDGDQDSLQKQLGGAFSLLQNMGKAGQEPGAASPSRSTAVPVLKPEQSALQRLHAGQQGGTQAAGTASLGAQHTGPEAQGPEDELQRARKMFAERRRLAEEKAATAGPAPFVFASGAGSNGLALRPSAKGPAQGAAADGPDAVKSTQPAAAKQLQNGLQHDIGNGFATSSQPSEDSIQGSLLQAVAELGSAMKAGERGTLEDAIRQGTATLYKAGSAPDTASVAAALRMLLRDAKPRLKQLISRPVSAPTDGRDRPTAAPAQPGFRPPHQAAAHPPRSLSPTSSTSSSLSSQHLHAQAGPRQLQQPHHQQQTHQQRQRQQQQQQQQQTYQQQRQQQGYPFRNMQGPGIPQYGHQLPVPGAGHAAHRPPAAQPPFAAKNKHQQLPVGSAAGAGPGMQSMNAPSAAQGHSFPPFSRPAQGYQHDLPKQPPPPPPRVAGHPPGSRPSANQPANPNQGRTGALQGPPAHAGYMHEPPQPPLPAHLANGHQQHLLPNSHQQQRMPESARAALPAHLQQALFATASSTAANSRSPIKQPVYVKAFADDGAKYVRPMPFGSTHKPQDDPDDDTDCVVCMDNVKNTVFVPCGHCLCCTACAEVVLQKNSTCPVCSTYIDSYCGTETE